jgi:putative NADH-flavin reductase
MKLVIFGATGGTGSQLLTQALDGGHEVTIIARNPDNAARRGHANLTVLVGDVLEPSTWVAGMAGHDAILSCLGSTDRKRPTTVYSRGTANIIEAMRTSGVRRLMCLSSAGLEIPPDTPLPVRLVTSVVIQRLYRHGYDDMAIMERTVATSDTDWTVIRAPMLTDGPFFLDKGAGGLYAVLRSVLPVDLDANRDQLGERLKGWWFPAMSSIARFAGLGDADIDVLVHRGLAYLQQGPGHSLEPSMPPRVADGTPGLDG